VFLEEEEKVEKKNIHIRASQTPPALVGPFG